MKKVILILSVIGLFTTNQVKAQMSNKSIVDIAVSNADFSTLVTALKAADLVGALQGEGPFTVFPPI
ncbi:fasciclin domain-containing protein [Eudoraea chungangensis]|uniref:fasciclin domain-containing protein n=1 Tax=Eudoraea chungangensis TaxID=1481905 RepID=UPI0030B9DCC8